MVEWLETVNPGWGTKFGTAFEEVGAENTNFIAHIGADIMAELDECLTKAGAKKLHLAVIHDAIESVKDAQAAGTPHRPGEVEWVIGML